VLPLRIATRFLRTSPVQTGLIIGGIAVGIAVQIFVGSLITSLQTSLLDKTIGSASHVTLVAVKDGDPIEFSPLVKSTVRSSPIVKTVVPVRTITAVFTKNTDNVPLSITGGQLTNLDTIYRLTARTISGKASLADGEIMVGKDFADKYGVQPGDRVALNIPKQAPINLLVSGVFDLGSSAANARTAFTGPGFAQRALGLSSAKYSAIQVQLTDPFASKTLAADWQGHLRVQGVKVNDWQVENKDLLSALASQSSSSYMIQVFVLVAVALGIASTLAISAVQKTRQIGILKALGLSDSAAGSIFLWQASIMGVGGVVGGITLGLLLIAGFTLGTAGSTSGFPIDAQPSFVAISAGIGLAVALLSAIIPTRRTTRLDPIEVIQNG
jgi:lipoprotein-releasing system permease protein